MPLLRTIFINLAVFFALALVLELIFGYWISGPDFGSLNVKINTTAVRDDSPYYPQGTPVVFKRDGYGLRGAYGEPADVTILAVGGSTTNDRVANEGDTWTDVLQAELNKRGKPHAIANAGIDGHSTVGHIRSFDLWFNNIPDLKPSYVIFYVGINDIGVEPGAVPRPDKLESDSWSKRLTGYIENHSVFVRVFKIVRGSFIAREIGVAYEFRDFRDQEPEYVPSTISHDLYDPNIHPAEKDKLDAYLKRLRILYTRAVDFGAQPIFVTQPAGLVKRIGGTLHVVKDSAADHMYFRLKEMNKVLLEFCTKSSAICVDLASELLFGPTDFYDNIHTTPIGSRKIGVFLADKLEEALP